VFRYYILFLIADVSRYVFTLKDWIRRLEEIVTNRCPDIKLMRGAFIIHNPGSHSDSSASGVSLTPQTSSVDEAQSANLDHECGALSVTTGKLASPRDDQRTLTLEESVDLDHDGWFPMEMDEKEGKKQQKAGGNAEGENSQKAADPFDEAHHLLSGCVSAFHLLQVHILTELRYRSSITRSLNL